MKKKILLLLSAVLVVAAGVAAMSAFEAHVINVTATIENALAVAQKSIKFGTVFPQEKLYEPLTIQMSESFQKEDRVGDINYVIKQKPKPATDDPEFGSEYCDEMWNAVWEDFMDCAKEAPSFIEGWEECKDVIADDYEYDYCLPYLCAFLSKHPQEGDGDYGVSAPHWPTDDPATGYLSKPDDISDTWTIDLVVPCFQEQCAQDYNWWEYGPPLNPAMEGGTFGCDLWIEVTGISTRYYSPVLHYGSMGWGGWSCPPEKPHAVGGGVIENAFPMGPEGIAEPGATIGGFTYPTFPHYVFGTWYPDETGYVAQNGGTSQTARIYVDCQ